MIVVNYARNYVNYVKHMLARTEEIPQHKFLVW